MYSDVLFELGLEELPSAAVKILGEALCSNIIAALHKRKIASEFDDATFEHQAFIMPCLATPRRIAVRFKIKTHQPEQMIVRQGPAYAAGLTSDGKPTKALLGFARSCDVDISALETHTTEKGQWWIHKNRVQSQNIKTILPSVILEAVHALPIVKSMHWGAFDLSFIRPVHWAVLLIDQDVIEMDILGCRTGRKTYGHRFHHPQAIEINTPEHYEKALQAAYVMVDFNQRLQKIKSSVAHVAHSVGGIARMDLALLTEVTSIVEWPVPLCVSFDSAFLKDVPPEALIASMQVHQKCFPIYHSDDQRLLPYFITVANIDSHDVSRVITGNERVMRARLSDAAFFYRQDRKQSLSDYVVKTEGVIFQEKLGSLKDKTKRIELLMQHFLTYLNLNQHDVQRAAYLCKADLMTAMVGEFPELEGLMGYYYAQHDGESEYVALALREQYLPRFSGDRLPETALGRALSLADRLDTLVGVFAIGIKPTAMKDPFKLRRHALAIIRILKETNALSPMDLSDLLLFSANTYQNMHITEQTRDELKQFILDRLPAAYAGDQISANLILAVRKRQENDLFDFEQRLFSLQLFFKYPESEALIAACKRVTRILQSVQLKYTDFLVDKRRLEKEIEKELLYKIESLEAKINDSLVLPTRPTQKEYDSILTELARFREPVDNFFEEVMVLVDDIALRNNRLCLLVRLQQLFQYVADISILS